MTLDEAIKRFESIKLYKNFEEFMEDCVYSRFKEESKICANDVNSLLFRGYGICDENHCPKYKKYVEYAEENHQLAEWLKELKRLKEQEPCDDCISRQAVVNAIANTCFWLSADNWTELMECISSLPSVTPYESILDKIRTEIKQAIREERQIDSMGGEYERIVSTIEPDDVLRIIDKYMAESEG